MMSTISHRNAVAKKKMNGIPGARATDGDSAEDAGSHPEAPPLTAHINDKILNYILL